MGILIVQAASQRNPSSFNPLALVLKRVDQQPCFINVYQLQFQRNIRSSELLSSHGDPEKSSNENAKAQHRDDPSSSTISRRDRLSLLLAVGGMATPVIALGDASCGIRYGRLGAANEQARNCRQHTHGLARAVCLVNPWIGELSRCPVEPARLALGSTRALRDSLLRRFL